MTVPLLTWDDPAIRWADARVDWGGTLVNTDDGGPIDSSHARLLRVTLYDPDDVEVADLPVTEGDVVGTAGLVDRWNADLVVAGDAWFPADPADPLSGFTGHYLWVRMGAAVGQVEQWWDVCRVWPYSARLSRSADQLQVTVRCVGPAAAAQQAAGRDHAALEDESCQDMIQRILTGTGVLPFTPDVDDTTVGVPAPDGYTSDRDVWATVLDLAARANVAVYFDRDGTLVIRDPLPATVTDPQQRLLSSYVQVTDYQVEVGRDLLANDVTVRFADPSDGGSSTWGGAVVDATPGYIGAATAAGTLDPTGPAGRITYTTDVDVPAVDQVAADRYAETVLTAQLSAWSTVTAQAVPDPRLYPDQLVSFEYLDGTVRLHRVVSVQIPCGPGDMTVTARTVTLTGD